YRGELSGFTLTTYDEAQKLVETYQAPDNFSQRVTDVNLFSYQPVTQVSITSKPKAYPVGILNFCEVEAYG
ncbi:unnamed protein product, partial [Candidula unifasciata]